VAPVSDLHGPLRSEDLYRLLGARIEFTRSEDQAAGTLGVMTGHFAAFNEWTRIDSRIEGRFMERFAPGAFAKTIRENRRMKALFKHGLDPQIGDKPLGPILRLEEDSFGPAYEVGLLDTLYNRELVPGLEAGLYGASFRFGAIKQQVEHRPRKSDYNPDGWPERTVTEAFVREFGPCTFGAYHGATAGMRCATDDITAQLLAARELDEPRGHSTALIPAAVATLESRLVDPLEEARREEQRYERVLDFVGSSIWAIEPSALQTILAILGERAAGYRPTEEEIRERIGMRALPDQPGDPDEEGPVTVIPVRGPIVPRGDQVRNVSGPGMTSAEGIQQKLRAALADDNVKGILLDVDSPGGNAALIPELAAEIMAARDQKPIYAVANTFAASAAYWIASACEQLFASPSAEVGSIGAYTAHNDLSAAQKKAGVKTTLVSAGKYKVERSPFAPLSDDAKAAMQDKIDELYDCFLQAVADQRGTTVDDVTANYGQGRVLSAQKAKDAGMVDDVATYDQAMQALLERIAADEPDGDEPEAPVGPTTPTAADRPDEPREPEPSVATTPTPRQTRPLYGARTEKEPWRL
jgi:HK97 family phage prohead protease